MTPGCLNISENMISLTLILNILEKVFFFVYHLLWWVILFFLHYLSNKYTIFMTDQTIVIYIRTWNLVISCFYQHRSNFSLTRWQSARLSENMCVDEEPLIYLMFISMSLLCSFFVDGLRWVASVRMSGTQRNQRRVPQSRAPPTNLPTSLASSTPFGSLWEPSCNRAVTSRRGE